MKRIVIIMAFIVLALGVCGQDVFTPVLQQIEQNNTTLQALRQQMEADKLQNRTGLTPDNPEVEFGYLWGNPGIIGHRKDFSVGQSFDFPTAYVQRGKLSRLQNHSVEFRHRVERMQLLLTAKDLCIELIYHNQMCEMYAKQLESAKKIVTAYEKMLKNGEANRLEYDKANLNYATLSDQLKRIDLKREHLLSELMTLNGGHLIVINEIVQIIPSLSADFEQWYAEAEANHPSLQYLHSQVDVAYRQVKVSQAEGLPKMSVGYMGEFVGVESFQGITVGLSIPLWQNKNRVKQARAAAVASEKAMEDNRVQYYNHLKSLYIQAIGLQQSATLYASSLHQYGNEALLTKAFEKGELSLLQYLMEMEYYYECFKKLAEAEKDLAHICAELNAYSL